MKYIRTKDGIITQEKGVELAKEKFGTIFYTEERATNYLNQFKQADTIEELIDEFVWNVKGSNKRIVANNIFPFSRIKLDLDKQFHGDYEIYGAIWTDKGLIYVAKMNEKGELELI